MRATRRARAVPLAAEMRKSPRRSSRPPASISLTPPRWTRARDGRRSWRLGGVTPQTRKRSPMRESEIVPGGLDGRGVHASPATRPGRRHFRSVVIAELHGRRRRHVRHLDRGVVERRGPIGSGGRALHAARRGASASVQRFSPQTDATVRTIGNTTTSGIARCGYRLRWPVGPLLRLLCALAGSPSGGMRSPDRSDPAVAGCRRPLTSLSESARRTPSVLRRRCPHRVARGSRMASRPSTAFSLSGLDWGRFSMLVKARQIGARTCTRAARSSGACSARRRPSRRKRQKESTETLNKRQGPRPCRGAAAVGEGAIEQRHRSCARERRSSSRAPATAAREARQRHPRRVRSPEHPKRVGTAAAVP